ncbi:uncharacterized protein FFC1_02219 [Fusarium fujikuroi]|nr:uncharacterized protein FFC1_02219 [Fusarium fujikuroi]
MKRLRVGGTDLAMVEQGIGASILEEL